MNKLSRTTKATAGILALMLPRLSLDSFFLGPVCTFVWSFCLLYCLRYSKTRQQFLSYAFLFYIAAFIRFSTTLGTEPICILGAALIILLGCVVLLAAYTLDRLAFRKNGRFISTLVYPAAGTLTHYIIELSGIGDTLNPAMTLFYFPWIIQICSVIGGMGLTFLFLWLISMLVSFCGGLDGKKRAVCLVLSAVLAVTVPVSGLSRMRQPLEEKAQIRVALVTDEYMSYLDETVTPTTVGQFSAFAAGVASLKDKGVDLVVTCEEYFVFCGDEESSVRRLGQLLKGCGIPVLAGLEIHVPDSNSSGHRVKNINSACLFDGDGNLLSSVHKYNLVPLIETSSFEKGDGSVGQAVLSIGGTDINVSFVICYDMNNSFFTGRIPSDTDLLVSLSWEWYSASYEQIATGGIRAVEEGVTFVKAVQDGFDTVIDPYGSILCFHDTVGEYGRAYIVDVPVKSTGTFYSRTFIK